MQNFPLPPFPSLPLPSPPFPSLPLPSSPFPSLPLPSPPFPSLPLPLPPLFFSLLFPFLFSLTSLSLFLFLVHELTEWVVFPSSLTKESMNTKCEEIGFFFFFLFFFCFFVFFILTLFSFLLFFS